MFCSFNSWRRELETIEDINKLTVSVGADKVSINTAAVLNKEFSKRK